MLTGTVHVFIRIVAVATINFILAGVWLLIEGGSYSRVALLMLEWYLGDIDTVDSFSRLIFEYLSYNMIEK